MERPDGTAAIASAAAAAAAVAAAEAAVADGSAGPCDGGRTSDDLDNGPAMDFVRLVSTAASRKGMHHRVVDATRALTFYFLRPRLTATLPPTTGAASASSSASRGGWEHAALAAVAAAAVAAVAAAHLWRRGCWLSPSLPPLLLRKASGTRRGRGGRATLGKAFESKRKVMIRVLTSSLLSIRKKCIQQIAHVPHVLPIGTKRWRRRSQS